VLDPPVAEHLTDCSECGTRFEELSSFMETLRDDAAAESDAVFSPERLRHQRLQIVRRIEHLGHSARVITFPDRTGGHPFSPSAHRSVRRLVAAAAAAGLFVGVGSGLVLERGARRGYARRSPIVATTLAQTEPRIKPEIVELVRPDGPESAEDFLSELELAGERPRIRELTAVDALTPHVREVNLK
jgi:anti-sigma factor RsiW